MFNGYESSNEILDRVSLSHDGSMFLTATVDPSSNWVCLGFVETGELQALWCGENRGVIALDWPKVFCLDHFEDRVRVLKLQGCGAA